MRKNLPSGLAFASVGLAGFALIALAQDTGAGNFEALVSIKELMEQTITPATDQLWSAYQEPSTTEDWKKMENASITLLAATSVTAMGGTGPMDNEWARQPAWQAFNRALIEAGKAALVASRDRNQEALLAAGDLLLPPCEGCHMAFNPAVVEGN